MKNYRRAVFRKGVKGKMVNPKLRDGLADQLCEAVLVLRDREECYQFFEDV